MRYIIIDPEEGVFLGTKDDPTRRGVGMLFSNHNLFELTKACSWKTEKSARDYLNYYIKRHLPYAHVAPVDVSDNTEHVSVIDIIKSGYAEYCAGMIEAIPMDNTRIH